MENFFLRDMFADVMSVHNRNTEYMYEARSRNWIWLDKFKTPSWSLSLSTAVSTIMTN